MRVDRNFNIHVHVPSPDLICHSCPCIDSLHSFFWFCRPHLFDYSDQLDKTPIDCCENAFSVAEQFLDVDRLLEPSGTVTAFIICLFLIKSDINLVVDQSNRTFTTVDPFSLKLYWFES